MKSNEWKRKTIKEYRNKLRLSQKDASKQIGIDNTHLSKYESGKLKLSPKMFFRIMKAYKADIGDMKVKDVFDL